MNERSLSAAVMDEAGRVLCSTPVAESGAFVEQDGWTLAVRRSPVGAHSGAWDVEVRAECTAPGAPRVCVALRESVASWSRDVYVLAPGCVYAGNRFQARAMRWPVQYTGPDDLGRADFPVTVSNCAQLNPGEGPSAFVLNSGDVSTPAIGYFDPVRRAGCVWLTPQAEDAGPYGYAVREADDRASAEVSVQMPALRPAVPGTKRPSGDAGARLGPGDTLVLRARVHRYAAPDIPAFIREFLRVRTELTGPAEPPCVYPYRAAFRAIEARFNRQHWHEDHHLYGLLKREDAAASPFGWEGIWHTGWIQGGLSLPALVAMGEPLSRERACETMDSIFSLLQAPTGLFYAHVKDRRPVGDFFSDKGARVGACLVRRQGDLVHSMIKTIETLRADGREADVKGAWLDGIGRACDGLVRLWRAHGQLGQFIDVETGALLLGGSTSGASTVLALAEASVLLDRPHYGEVAAELGQSFNRFFLERGFTCGGPSEAGQAPDSETAYALLEGYWALYAATRDAEWLERAVDAADLLATWCVSHDFVFPTGSFFHRIGIRASGTVMANSMNRHSAPGLCTASGDALLKLYRATGERRHLQLVRDIARALPQFVSRPGAEFPLQELSWINERVNLSDWEGRDKIGNMVFPGTCWCEHSVMLSALDLPGLYVDADRGELHGFDHVRASWRDESGKRLLQVENPTAYDAACRVLIERAADRARPYGWALLRDCPVVSVPAGGHVLLDLSCA